MSVVTASVNGSTKTTVLPGTTLNAGVTVTIGDTVTWSGTGWRISQTPPGTVTCVNTTEVKGPASGVLATFPFTAPTTEGTYNAYFVAAEDSNTCASGVSATYTMTGAV